MDNKNFVAYNVEGYIVANLHIDPVILRTIIENAIKDAGFEFRGVVHSMEE